MHVIKLYERISMLVVFLPCSNLYSDLGLYIGLVPILYTCIFLGNSTIRIDILYIIVNIFCIFHMQSRL